MVKSVSIHENVSSQEKLMWTIKALTLTLQKNIGRLKLLGISQMQGQNHMVNITGINGKTVSYRIFMWIVKVLALSVQNLLARLKGFFYVTSKAKVTEKNADTHGKVSTQ